MNVRQENLSRHRAPEIQENQNHEPKHGVPWRQSSIDPKAFRFAFQHASRLRRDHLAAPKAGSAGARPHRRQSPVRARPARLDQVSHRQRHRRARHLAAQGAAARRRPGPPGPVGDLVPVDPAAQRGGPASDRHAARADAEADHPAPDRVLRRQQIRRAGLPDHDRRRGSAQPGRDRAGPACRRAADRGGGPAPVDPHQRAR